MAQKINTRKKSSLSQKLKKTKWYVLIPIVIIVGLLLNLIYKRAMTKYDISLLDKAETKLRALDLPKADKTIYKRSCSVRSVKFQDPGYPRCSLNKVDIYKINNTDEGFIIGKKFLNVFAQSFKDYKVNYANDEEFKELLGERVDYSPQLYKLKIQNSLECSVAVRVDKEIPAAYLNGTDNLTSPLYLYGVSGCYKDFPLLAYPED